MRQVENRKSAKHEKATKLGAKKTAPVDLPLDSNISHQIIDGVTLANAGMAHGVVTVASADDQGSGHSSGGGLGSAGLILGGLALAGGIGAAASGGSTVTVPTPTPAPAPVAVSPAPLPLDTVAPVFSSSSTQDIYDNSAAGTRVYIARATDNQSDVVYSLANKGDGSKFAIDPISGVVTSKVPIDYEDPNNGSHSFNITVIATDVTGNATNKDVVLKIIDLPESVGVPAPIDISSSYYNVVQSFNYNSGNQITGALLTSFRTPVYNGGVLITATAADITNLTGLISNISAALPGRFANNSFFVKVTDNQATPGTDYSGFYLVAEYAGAIGALDSGDYVAKMVGNFTNASVISFVDTTHLVIA